MDGFVKIYGSKLITSSLWDEAPEARLVFLSLLSIADSRGYVDVPNERALARLLNLPPDYVQRALTILMAPDEGSRTPTNEGRRVVRDGTGWLCVNYAKYREFRTSKQEVTRLRVERFREGNGVTCNVGNAVKRLEAEGEAEGEKKKKVAARGPDYPIEFEHIWKAALDTKGLGNSLKTKALEAWIATGKPVVGVTERWGMYLASLPEWQSPKHFNGWLKARGFEQEYQPPATGKAFQRSLLQRIPDDVAAERARRG